MKNSSLYLFLPFVDCLSAGIYVLTSVRLPMPRIRLVGYRTLFALEAILRHSTRIKQSPDNRDVLGAESFSIVSCCANVGTLNNVIHTPDSENLVFRERTIVALPCSATHSFLPPPVLYVRMSGRVGSATFDRGV